MPGRLAAEGPRWEPLGSVLRYLSSEINGVSVHYQAKGRNIMSDSHIDARLGPERDPRQGAGYIRRWVAGWRELMAEYQAGKQLVYRPARARSRGGASDESLRRR